MLYDHRLWFAFNVAYRVLAEKLNLSYEEAERWIVNLIRTSKLEAKIDSETGTIIMEPNHTNVYVLLTYFVFRL